MKRRSLNKACSLIAIIVVPLFCGCAVKKEVPSNRYSESKPLMGTFVQLEVCLNVSKEKRERAYKKAWQRLEEISWRMNVYDERSDVVKINRAYDQAIQIEEDTYAVLIESANFSRLTEGAFDITIRPLLNLWRKAEKDKRLPDREEINRIKEAVGIHNVQLLSNAHVRLQNPLTKIDLGGIAKGYAVDEAARIFREHDIDNFYIEAGGDVYAGGHNCQQQPWRIGIVDPRDRSKVFDVVGVVNKAVTTSGNYEQYFEIDGMHFSHIINPITGYPVKEVVSATVIAPTAQDADALSTALSVLGAQRGTALIESLKGGYASLIITSQAGGRIIKQPSKKYKQYQLEL